MDSDAPGKLMASPRPVPSLDGHHVLRVSGRGHLVAFRHVGCRLVRILAKPGVGDANVHVATFRLIGDQLQTHAGLGRHHLAVHLHRYEFPRTDVLLQKRFQWRTQCLGGIQRIRLHAAIRCDDDGAGDNQAGFNLLACGKPATRLRLHPAEGQQQPHCQSEKSPCHAPLPSVMKRRLSAPFIRAAMCTTRCAQSPNASP